MCVSNDAPIGAIHVGVFNPRGVTPICPVDGAIKEENVKKLITLEFLKDGNTTINLSMCN